MKTKFKLQGLLFIALLYISLICLNWYTNLNEVRLYEEKDKRELTQLEINKYVVKPDNKKDYYANIVGAIDYFLLQYSLHLNR